MKLTSVLSQFLGWDGGALDTVCEAVGELDSGEILLLCTDGLNGELSDAEIVAVLAEDAPIQVKARRLVDRAISKGGSDNITVALISPAA